MPGNVAIFIPVAVLALWTLAVLLMMSISHVGASAPAVTADATTVPPTRAAVANRNLMNLLEVPVLFYVACIVLYVTGGASYLTIVIAWIYVVLRIVHSAIHLTYNRVRHRGLVFAASNVVVVVLWVTVIVHVSAATAVY